MTLPMLCPRKNVVQNGSREKFHFSIVRAAVLEHLHLRPQNISQNVAGAELGLGGKKTARTSGPEMVPEREQAQ
jgi:hypothetical protein